mmetsp:Transcript_5791/g.12854  ORF Transcript_5791/g.12854 Transcript_5791/m.12854 type:complete len:302 (-) Transcript_5791:4142-5047(-)
MVNVKQGIKVLELSLERRLSVDRLHSSIASSFEAASFVYRELPRLQVAHGVVATNESVIVQLLLLLLHKIHPVENLGNAALQIGLSPVGTSAHRIRTTHSRCTIADSVLLHQTEHSWEFSTFVAARASDDQLLHILEPFLVRQARRGSVINDIILVNVGRYDVVVLRRVQSQLLCQDTRRSALNRLAQTRYGWKNLLSQVPLDIWLHCTVASLNLVRMTSTFSSQSLFVRWFLLLLQLGNDVWNVISNAYSLVILQHHLGHVDVRQRLGVGILIGVLVQPLCDDVLVKRELAAAHLLCHLL